MKKIKKNYFIEQTLIPLLITSIIKLLLWFTTYVWPLYLTYRFTVLKHNYCIIIITL